MPIEPWLGELVARMHEATALGLNTVDCSSTHPRGYIPNQILRRPKARELLRGWAIRAGGLPELMPPNGLWVPMQGLDLNTCDLRPFEHEIEVRQYEADLLAYNQALQDGERHIPILDLTCWHPRGGIPDPIMRRLERRKSPTWRRETEAEIRRLKGEANQAVAFAGTQLERAQSKEESEKGDPTALRASAAELKRRAAELRATAAWLETELGVAA